MNLKKIIYINLSCLVFCITNSYAWPSDPLNTRELIPPNQQTPWTGDVTALQAAIPPADPTLPPELRGGPLSLARLTAYALAHNPATALSWAQVEQAAAQLGQAKGANWPQINDVLNMSYIDGGSVQKSNVGENYSHNLSISYLLWDFGQTRNHIASVRWQLIASNLAHNTQLQQVILDVEQSYYQLLGEQALVNADQSNLDATHANWQAAQALHQQGMATLGDVAQAASAQAQAELTLQQAQGQLANFNGELATELGLPVQTHLNLAPLQAHLAVNQINQNINHYLIAAQQNRPDLLAAAAQIKAAQSQMASVRAENWPTLRLNASTGQTRLVGVPSTNQSEVGVTLSIPIFNGFQRNYDLAQAQASLDAANASAEMIRNQVSLQVWNSYFSLQTAAANIDSVNELLQQSQLAARQARGQYRAGVGNILAVLTTQAAAASAQAQQIEATLNWYINLAQLSAAMGHLNYNGNPQL